MMTTERIAKSRKRCASTGRCTQPGHTPPVIQGHRLVLSSLVILLMLSLTTCATPPAGAAQATTPLPPSPSATATTPATVASNAAILDTDVTVALISFLAGSFAALLGVLSKYFLDYRLERQKLERQERQDIAAAIGTSQANLVRAARELYRWLSSLFDHPPDSREWLQPGSIPGNDAYSLREFVRLLFNFIAWGRITQDAINSLPSLVVKERSDLQQAFVFVDLVFDLLAYGGLFRQVEAYQAKSQTMRLFMGDIETVAEAGLQLWQADEQTITRAAVDELYRSADSPLLALREFVLVLHGEPTLAASFILARLAAVRAVSAGFLLGYSWTIDVPHQNLILVQLQKHLTYAAKISGADLPFGEHGPRNLSLLLKRYRCKFLRRPALRA